MVNNTMYNEPIVNLNLGNDNDVSNMKHNINSNNCNNNNLTQINYDEKHMQHAHNPYVKLSLDNDDFMKVLKPNVNTNMLNNNNNNSSSSNAVINSNQPFPQSVRNQNDGDGDIDSLHKQVTEINKGKRVVKRRVEITTKVTYVYEDGSQREHIDKKCHDYNN